MGTTDGEGCAQHPSVSPEAPFTHSLCLEDEGWQGNKGISFSSLRRETLLLGTDFWKFLYPNYALPSENYKLKYIANKWDWWNSVEEQALGNSLVVQWLVVQKCPTLCDPTGHSPPGSSVRGNLQARILEWGAISSSRGSCWPRDQTQVSRIIGRFFTIWATSESDTLDFPGGTSDKESPCWCRRCKRHGLDLCVGKIAWRSWQPIPVFSPGESPWTEEAGGLWSLGSQRVGHN